MKNLSIVLAALGGIVVGASLGLMFAPEKGADLRTKIKSFLKEKGLKLKGQKLEEIVDDIAAEIEAVG